MIAKIVALPISFLLAPLFLLIAILNLIFLGLPIFFKQERVGKDNKTFNLIKFRTMYVKESKEVDTIKDRMVTKNFFEVPV